MKITLCPTQGHEIFRLYVKTSKFYLYNKNVLAHIPSLDKAFLVEDQKAVSMN